MSFTWCFHQKPGKTPVWFSAESARRDLLAAESESQGVTMVLTLQSQPLYPLVMSDKKLLKMAIEIVDLPFLTIKNGGSFHSYVNVYQRLGEIHPKVFLVFWVLLCQAFKCRVDATKF